MEQNTTPVLLLTGYLGSGKTTLLNRILGNQRGIRFAVIVNDIGEVNIDASLIAREGIVGQSDDSLVPLQNGCKEHGKRSKRSGQRCDARIRTEIRRTDHQKKRSYFLRSICFRMQTLLYPVSFF